MKTFIDVKKHRIQHLRASPLLRRQMLPRHDTVERPLARQLSRPGPAVSPELRQRSDIAEIVAPGGDRAR